MRFRLPPYFRLTKGLTLTISVVIALILWTMLKLKDDYETTFAFPCKISNLPAGVQLQSAVIPAIHFKASGKGNALLAASLRWKQDTLWLKYDNIFKKGSFEPNAFLSSFQHFPANIIIEKAVEDSISLHFVANISKKVPIIAEMQIQLADNYHLFSQPQLMPDSITLYGDAKLLQAINSWKAVVSATEKINNPIILKGLLAQKEGIVCDPKTISVSISPQPFTEIQLSVPIQVQNVPANVEVVFQPTSLSPRCIVPFADYEKLKQGTFPYFISYDSLQYKSSFLPNYSFLPNNVQVSAISIQEVNYTIRTIED